MVPHLILSELTRHSQHRIYRHIQVGLTILYERKPYPGRNKRIQKESLKSVSLKILKMNLFK